MFELGPKKYNSYFSRSRIIKIKLTSVKRQQHLHWIQIFTAVDHELCIHTIENHHRTVERERFLLFRYFAFIHYERFDNLIIISSYTCCQWNTQWEKRKKIIIIRKSRGPSWTFRLVISSCLISPALVVFGEFSTVCLNFINRSEMCSNLTSC